MNNVKLKNYVKELEADIGNTSTIDHYESENKKLSDTISVQKSRIQELESALKSTADKPPRPFSRHNDRNNVEVDSSNIPTFSGNAKKGNDSLSYNVFTLSDESNPDNYKSSGHKHERVVRSLSPIKFKDDTQIIIKEEYKDEMEQNHQERDEVRSLQKYNSSILYETSESDQLDEELMPVTEGDLVQKWFTFHRQRLENKIKSLSQEKHELKKENLKLHNSLNQGEHISNAKLNQAIIEITQLKETHDVEIRRLTSKINELAQQNDDLLSKEQASIDRFKELREEYAQGRSIHVEQESELKSQLKDIIKEMDDLNHKFEHTEALIKIRDEQIAELENELQKLLNNQNSTYYEEFLEAKAQAFSYQAQNKHNLVKIDSLCNQLSKVKQDKDSLEGQVEMLETELRLNKTDYENLTLEIEEFSKDIENLQNENSRLLGLLRHEQLRTEEAQLKLVHSNTSNPNIDKLRLDTTAFTSLDMRNKSPDFTSIQNVAIGSLYQNPEKSKISASLNKLTLKMYDMFKILSNSESRLLRIHPAQAIEQVFQGMFIMNLHFRPM